MFIVHTWEKSHSCAALSKHVSFVIHFDLLETNCVEAEFGVDLVWPCSHGLVLVEFYLLAAG